MDAKHREVEIVLRAIFPVVYLWQQNAIGSLSSREQKSMGEYQKNVYLKNLPESL